MNKKNKFRTFRILIIAPTPYFSDRGCHVRIYEEAKALVTKGHSVCICTYHLGRDMAGIPTYRTPAIPWYKKKTAGPSWHKPYLDILLFYKAMKVSKRFKPDIIHAHLHEGAFIGYFLKKLTGAPMMFDCQGSLSGEILDHGFIRESSLLHKFFLSVERRINRWADWAVASSIPTKKLLVEDFKLPESRILFVGDGVDTERFRPGLGSLSLRKEIDLPAGKKIVVFLGAMTEYQGLDILIEAIKLSVQESDRLHFLLMGYPEEKYVDLAQKAGVSSFITFTGRIDYALAPEFLCLGDLAVSPKLSRTEANGKLYNYMACGLPTVVFESPVNREILGDLGIYAEFGNASDLARQMINLAFDDKRRLELGRMVRERSIDAYSWNRIADEITQVYERMLTPEARSHEH